MNELLLGTPTWVNPEPPETGDVIFFLDMDQGKETINNRPIQLSGGAVFTKDHLVNGKGSLSCPSVYSHFLMNLNPVINLGGTSWTIEWWDEIVGDVNVWTNMLYLSNANGLYGVMMRIGDAGYGGWPLLCEASTGNDATRNEGRVMLRASNYGRRLTHHAITCTKDGKIRYWFNGVKQNIQLYLSSSTNQPVLDHMQVKSPANLDNLNTLHLGGWTAYANNVPRFYGNLRMCNYLKYATNSLPEPF